MSKKSDHKHLYEPCFLRIGYKEFSWFQLGQYCSICGKTKCSPAKGYESSRSELLPNGLRVWTSKTTEELIEEYKDLIIIEETLDK